MPGENVSQVESRARTKDPRLDVSSEFSKAEGEQEGSGGQRANRGQVCEARCVKARLAVL